VSSDGAILARIQDHTHAERQPEAVVRSMVEALQQLQTDMTSAHRLRAIGFGIPGILEPPGPYPPPESPGWQNFDLRRSTRARCRLPLRTTPTPRPWVKRGSVLDVVCNIFMLTLGRALAVRSSRVQSTGAHGYAGELGHTVVDPNGPLCRCGSYGCLEQFASAQQSHVWQSPTRQNHRPGSSPAARRGEPQALEVYHRVDGI
jgi:glucokinase